MKLQICSFKRTDQSPVEKGVACVKSFNLCNVRFILDESGDIVKEVYDYKLERVLAHGIIDTETFSPTLLEPVDAAHFED